MTKSVFPTFQTHILDFSSAISNAEHWDLPNTEIFQSKDVASAFFHKISSTFYGFWNGSNYPRGIQLTISVGSIFKKMIFQNTESPGRTEIDIA
jgi:hypothetical protein